MKSLLFQPGTTSVSEPTGCSALSTRSEVPINIRKDGRIYRFVLRDKLAPEDLQVVMIRAQAFSVQTGEAYNGRPPKRNVKDFLIKSNITI